MHTAAHAHMMSLSSDFHDSKTSMDLLNAVTGSNAVTELLELVCFQVLPMFIDLAVAVAYLGSLFGPYMGLMIAATGISYFYVTTKLVSIRAPKRRDYMDIRRKEVNVGYSSLDSWTTASVRIGDLRASATLTPVSFSTIFLMNEPSTLPVKCCPSTIKTSSL